MRTAFILSLLVAGALSTPVKRDYVEKDVVVVKTITITEGYVPVSTPPPPPPHVYTYTYGGYRGHRHIHKSSSSAVKPTTAVVPKPVNTPTPKLIEVPTPTPKTTSIPSAPKTKSAPPPAPPASTPIPKPSPSPSPASSGNDGSPLSDGVSLLTTVNKYRQKYNLEELVWSEHLAGNAQRTGDDGQGVNQHHELFSGSNAQVITPGTDHKVAGLDYGSDTCFELSYAAWLCEVQDPELLSPVNQCELVQKNLNMRYDDTGHHDILTSTSYKSIGCGFAKNPQAAASSPYQGLWVCDLSLDENPS